MRDYIEQAIRTESVPEIWLDTSRIRLLHAGIGMATESGEFLDALKKHLYYGKPLDLTNLREEIGDLLWYMAIALDELDTDFDEVMETNINKLRIRYPDKFKASNALERDLDAEREELER